MTRMIRLRALILQIVLSVASVVTVAVVAFVTVRRSPAVDPSALKFLVERILFIGIVATVVVAAGGIAVIWRSAKFSMLLDKLIEMNRVTGFSPETALNKLGDVGKKISTIYRQMTELSEKKSRKISALTALNELLISVADRMILIVDAGGRVLHASAPLLKQINQTSLEIQKVFMDDLIPEARVESAIKEASQSHAPVVRERKGDSLVLSPVLDRNGEVAYLVAILTRSVTDDMRRVAATENAVVKERTRQRLIRRIFRPRT
jgi:hypothetical protein